MNVPQTALCQASAEFYLCIARAFLSPTDPEAYRAFSSFLVDDLDDLGTELGYPIAEPVADLRAALDDIPDLLTLLQIYSKLFLTPPAPVCINTGLYLDGGVMGANVRALEERYRRGGLARAESFCDLSDHVALQLEFVAYLFGSAAAASRAGDPTGAARYDAEARAFLADFIAAWLPAFRADLERAATEQGVASPYASLARILGRAVECDAASPREHPAVKRAVESGDFSRIGPDGPTPAQLAEIARTLAAKGHSTDHLAIPVAKADAALGLAPLDAPVGRPGRPR